MAKCRTSKRAIQPTISTFHYFNFEELERERDLWTVVFSPTVGHHYHQGAKKTTRKTNTVWWNGSVLCVHTSLQAMKSYLDKEARIYCFGEEIFPSPQSNQENQ